MENCFDVLECTPNEERWSGDDALETIPGGHVYGEKEEDNKINLKDWILKIAEDEPIVGVVIDNSPESLDDFISKVQTWESAKSQFDFELYPGFAGKYDMIPFWVWTSTKVIGVKEYDGSTELVVMPRNPTNGCPIVF